ncbi:Retinol dehydrogenase 10-B [Lucilia cuprina]|nr:Retinol dehydrogenase 10-B [Lucilia cuprina]
MKIQKQNQNQLKIAVLEFYYSLYVIATLVIYPVLIVFAVFIKLFKFIQNKQQNKTIKGQVAVITGSGRGLGRILAIELAKRGCHVAIVDIEQNLAEETAKFIAQEYQVKTKAYQIDVSDYHQLEELNKNVSQDLGNVTILINNAAILTLSSMLNPSPEEIQRMINVNFTSICFAQQIFLPKMKELNNGHIVNICSSSALFTSPFFNIYAGTKAAVRSITSALRIEIMNEFKNITATTVMPLFLNTNQRVERLINMSGLTKIFPLIEGPIVAQYVLDSMLNNEDEITIPNAFLYIYKLYELLPISVKEFGNALITFRGYNRLLKSLKAKSLGRDIAKELAARGCHIAIVDIKENLALETAQYLTEMYDIKSKAYKVDVSNYEQLEQLRISITADLGVPTILINNAAILAGSSLINLSPHEVKQMIEVNITAVYYILHIFLPKLKELNQGYIVNICSLSALVTSPLLSVYGTTKAAIRSLSSALRIEFILERKNITVTTVMPTFLSTNKTVEKIHILSGLGNLLPKMEGEVCAKYAINGMLNGSREIAVPSVMLYMYKLLEILPVLVKELFSAVIVSKNFKTMKNSAKIAEVLNKRD